VFATQPAGDLPKAVRGWVETWVDKRGEREGTLFGLHEPTRDSTTSATAAKFAYLRSAAHRAGLDYLTQAAQNAWHSVPDSIETFSERAEQMTTVLDEILRYRPTPRPQSD
jgi:hypothetical protein